MFDKNPFATMTATKGASIAGVSMATLLLLAPLAFAVPPTSITQTGGLHFVGQPDLTVNKSSQSASLTASGEVAGAGTKATAVLSAKAEVTQGCVNQPGHEPSGLKKTTTTVTGSQSFDTRSGRGTFSVTTDSITAPSGGFTCPPGQKGGAVLVSVTFTEITLTITSGPSKSLTATFPDQDP